MPILLKDNTGNFVPVPEGTHLAICYQVVELGVQPDQLYGAKSKVCVTWELPDAKIATPEGKQLPMSISKTYTASLNTKCNLRIDLVRWRGREFTEKELEGFALGAILGKACQVTVIHVAGPDKKVKARLVSVAGLPKNYPPPPKPVNPLVEYTLSQGKDKVYLALPEWIRKMVDIGLQNLAETQAQVVEPEPAPLEEEHVPEPDGDDVPF